ncbi:hypothetical protein JYB87_00755 [Shewanella avicenniae]|uniref:Uncharacterized protein n=1 Tax=Shewanella avicenniae TaxID=2814294 RepID=A0ABX7QRZ8_9GAMM|nr:hypothetical protein [Shewanella avicenniae]QSX33817.1 hypothetical protein JYB87_00755 [Shewanella avicenniae]
MKRTSFFTCTALSVLSCALAADPLSVSSLANLSVSFTSVSSVNQIPASPVPAQVSFEPGNAFVLSVPETIQQHHWLVSNGSVVVKEQPIALLQGAGIHHFQMQFAAAEESFDLAESRYQHNKPLHKKGTIGAEMWSQISEQYFAAKLKFEHMHHFMELLQPAPAQQGMVLLAPKAGVLRYDVATTQVMEGEPLLSLIPLEDIRLQLQLPLMIAAEVQAVQLANCQLPIEHKAQLAVGGFVQAWSAAIPDECGLTLGQQLQATPLRSLNALQLPKQSVYSWGTGSRVLRHQGEQLLPTEVLIVGVSGDSYLVQPEPALEHSEVLSESVAAAKGMLLGLGGE